MHDHLLNSHYQTTYFVWIMWGELTCTDKPVGVERVKGELKLSSKFPHNYVILYRCLGSNLKHQNFLIIAE